MPEMNDYAKVRKWQVQFEVHRPFATLPLPDIVVEEERSSPLYRLDGRLRGDSGGSFRSRSGGRGGIRIAGVDHPLTPGRAFLHNHGDRDVCYYYPSDGTEVWNFLWMAFDGDYVKTLIAEINRKYGYLFDVPLNSPLVAKLMSFKNYQNEIQVLSPLEAGTLALDAIGMLCASKRERAARIAAQLSDPRRADRHRRRNRRTARCGVACQGGSASPANICRAPSANRPAAHSTTTSRESVSGWRSTCSCRPG